MSADRARPDTLLLLAIVAVATFVRLWGISFGLPHVRVRPDELMILGIILKMHEGQANPGLFDYPGLYMYTVAGVFAVFYGLGLVLGWFSSAEHFVRNFFENWEPYYLIARVMSALLGAATVVAVHAVARALLGVRVALLAALFMSLAFLHVRDSHYATTDALMTFFIVCAMVAAVRVHRVRDARDAWLAGALAGCATSVKYNAVLIVLALAAVEGLHAWRHRGDWRRVFRETQIFRMAAACIFVFAVTNPYLFIDYQRAIHDLRALQANTAAGMTPCELLGRGWTYHLPYSLRYGLGIPLLAASLLGIVGMAARNPGAAVILGIFPVAYYAAVGAGCNVFVRYMIPTVPFLCIFAAHFVSTLADAVSSRTRLRRPGLLAAVLGLATVAPSAWSVVRFDYLLTQEDNRLVAARWIHEHVPSGSAILMSGSLYGHPQLERGPVARYRYIEFDRRAREFVAERRRTEARPDWIVVQRHPIPYAVPAPQIMELVGREYELVHTIRALDPSAKNFYDIQDGFYAPFGGFEGVRRLGPNFEIYRRKSSG